MLEARGVHAFEVAGAEVVEVDAADLRAEASREKVQLPAHVVLRRPRLDGGVEAGRCMRLLLRTFDEARIAALSLLRAE